eukprot:1227052-Rhodomonas_salina.1
MLPSCASSPGTSTCIATAGFPAKEERRSETPSFPSTGPFYLWRGDKQRAAGILDGHPGWTYLGEEEDTPPHACHDELGTATIKVSASPASGSTIITTAAAPSKLPVELVWQLRELPNPPFDTEDVRMSG